jgi:hypothetical protein
MRPVGMGLGLAAKRRVPWVERLLEQAISINDTSPTFTRASIAIDPFANVAVASGARRRWPLFASRRTTLYSDLIEPARTNLALRSQEFDNSGVWTRTTCSVTANAIAAPDGTLTADKLVEDATAASQHRLNQTITKAASALAYTFSVYVKAAERTVVNIGFSNAANTALVAQNFDLGLGTTAGAMSLIGFTAGSADIEPIGGGWFCIWVTATSDTDTSLIMRIRLCDGTGSVSYNGDGVSGMYLSWAQLEQAAWPTSPIITTTVAVARAADALLASLTGLVDSRTNYISWSEQLDNVAWTTTRATITANATADPNGNLYADKMVEDATAANSHITAATVAAVTNGVVYTYSCYLKAAERTFAALGISSTILTGGGTVFFDLSNGTVARITGNPTSAAVVSVGNGWYRCSVTFTATASASAPCFVYICQGSVTTNTNGDGVSGIYVWGAHLAPGSIAGDYLTTVGTPFTTPPTGLNLTNGTLIAICIPFRWTGDQDAGVHSWRPLQDPTATSTLFGRSGATTLNVRRVDAGGAEQVSVTHGMVKNAKSVIAMTWNPSRVKGYVNGTSAGTDTTLQLPYLSTTSLNVGGVGGTEFSGRVAILYYPRDLSDSEISAITNAIR